MNLLIHINNSKNCLLKIVIDDNEYCFGNGKHNVTLNNHNVKLKVDIVSIKKKNSDVKYCFHFHKKESKDFFQFEKIFNSYSCEYELTVHRDAELYLSVERKVISNAFSLYDTYSKLIITGKTNLKILKISESIISKQNIRYAIIIDSLMLLVRILFSIFICILCCYFAYYYRYEMRTIFQGEMVWVINLIYILSTSLYISLLLNRNIKYFKLLLTEGKEK